MQIPEIPNLILYAIPFFVITIIIEGVLIQKRSKKNYDFKDSLASISMGIGNVIVSFIANLILVFIISFLYDNFKLFTIPFEWWAWLLILFLDDICYYFFHRVSHESRFFWASHIVHHSSKKYNLSTALRQTWTGGFFNFVFYLALPIFGFHPLMIFTQMSISLLYQYWIHTELINKMPNWFEYIFNTPSHHRVHHGSNPLYLDRNYAGIFIIWDKLFGTFQPELKEEKVTYGLTTNINTFNPFKIAFAEWASIFKTVIYSKTSFLNKLKYLSKPPGWQHDNLGKLSKDIRKEWLDKNEHKIASKDD